MALYIFIWKRTHNDSNWWIQIFVFERCVSRKQMNNNETDEEKNSDDAISDPWNFSRIHKNIFVWCQITILLIFNLEKTIDYSKTRTNFTLGL